MNRARPEAKSVLFSALDHRATVELEGGRNEIIKGDAENLIVFGTINQGRGYKVQPMDIAEKRRFGAKWDVDYLGVTYPDREAQLIEERTGIDRPVAERAVDDLFEDEDPGAAARAHAATRWARLSDEDDPRRRKQKLYRYLRRRGFTSDTIYPILDELEREGGPR